MDSILNTVVIALLVGIAPAVVAALGPVLVGIVVGALVVTDRSAVARLDRRVALGWCSARAAETRLPADGWHLAWLGGRLPCLAIRQTSTGSGNHPVAAPRWTVYSFDPATARARITAPDAAAGGTRQHKMVVVEQPSPWELVTSTLYVGAPKPRAWQVEALKAMLNAYSAPTGGTARRVTALVCGPPGVGKSALGVLFAEALAANADATGAAPVIATIIRGFDPCRAGAALGKVLNDGGEPLSPATPLVLELAEYDGAVGQAAAQQNAPATSAECKPIASTKTGLLTMLDTIASVSDLIAILTTNHSPQALADMAGGGAPGTTWADRTGRVDIRIAVGADGECTIERF